jgi:hypothetical protein
MEEVKNDIDVELQLAQAALARAQQRKADAEEAARLAAQAALAKNLADEQERLTRLQREAEETQRRWAEKRAAEEAARRLAEVAKAAETRRLEAEFEARQEAAREEAARHERIRKVTEQARQVEIDAANLEASLRQANTPREESKPVTVQSPEHPLSFLFTGQSRTEETIPAPVPMSAPVTMPQVKAVRKPCVPDGNDVVALGKLWYSTTKERPSPMKFEALLGKGYSVSEIETALRAVQSQDILMSSDGRLNAVESLLEAENVSA